MPGRFDAYFGPIVNGKYQQAKVKYRLWPDKWCRECAAGRGALKYKLKRLHFGNWFSLSTNIVSNVIEPESDRHRGKKLSLS